MKVWNIKDAAVPDDAVYIGRPSRWGNPFAIGRDGTREQVIEKYKAMLKKRPDLVAAMVKELSGRDLVCYCAPKACHGDAILEAISDAEEL